MLCLALPLLLSGTADPVLASEAADRPDAILKPVEFPTEEGDTVLLGLPRSDGRCSVLLFASAKDPASAAAAEVLAGLILDYQSEGFDFWCVNANSDEIESGAAHLEVGDLRTVLDPLQTLAHSLGVRNNAEVVVLDAEQKVCYRGAVERAGEPILVEVLEELLMEEAPQVEFQDGPGRPLADVWDDARTSSYTFAADIAPLLQRECLECHRSGQIGPMQLESYEDSSAWAAMIAEVVAEGRMPPWNASPAHGEFRNARRLRETEKMKIVRWAVSGAPQGDLTAAPEPPAFPAAEWELGDPDLVVKIPRQDVPATGTIDYRYIMVDPNFAEDRWVEGMEVLPGNREVVHHIIAFMIPEGANIGAFLNDPNSSLGEGFLVGYAPGARAFQADAGQAMLVPAKTRFLFEIHYTANGVATADESRLGLNFAEGEIDQRIRTKGIVNWRIDIAPGDPAATFHAEEIFRTPIEVLSVSPHMHSRGKSFTFDYVNYDDESERILSVPEYDFNWQHTYEFVDPIIIDAGESLRITAVYDNSEANPFNPDPTARVRWGEQTWEEMMIGFMTYVEVD